MFDTFVSSVAPATISQSDQGYLTSLWRSSSTKWLGQSSLLLNKTWRFLVLGASWRLWSLKAGVTRKSGDLAWIRRGFRISPLSWPATWLSSQPIVRGPVAVRGLRDASKLPPGWVANNAVIKRDGWFPTKPTEYRQEACYYPSNVDWCKWSGWLYFPPTFRQLSWHCPSKLSTIQWGRYLNDFHSRPMLWSECSQYLGRRLNMGVDNFCWWLTFLWLVLCLIVFGNCWMTI